MSAETYSFKAEVKQLLHILVHSLYKEQDIFLRELISNASDALTRLHFEMLTNKDVVSPDAELAIRIEVPEVAEGEPKKIIIKDSGIGMTAEELVQNLGTIAQSGAREFLRKISENKDANPGDVIGQFGVGFYSLFMVAEKVRVVSRSYKPEATAAVWISDGSETFQVEPAEKEDRGTEIHIELKPEANEYAATWKLRQIVKKHSDFVRFPVYVGEEQANQQKSLWRQRPSEVTQEEYKNFYRQMTMDFEEPLATIHFSSDTPVPMQVMLFIPSKREKGILASRKEPGLMLYSHNVLIQEYCTDILPNWLNYIDGVVDCEELSLNVSRESIQNTRLMRHIAKTVRSRIFRELKKMAEKEPEQYGKFWEEFGRAFKEGIATDHEAKEEILPFLRYHSSKSEDLISLDTYVERMTADQDKIYYVLGDSVKSVANSPHLDPFKSRDLEVLYWIDPLDALIASAMDKYKEKQFQSVAEAGLELPETEEAAEEATPVLPEEEFNGFVGRCVTTLGERVVEVRPAKHLKDSPVRLVSPADAAGNPQMDRLSRLLNQNYEVPKKVMEVNRNHPLIVNLAHLISSDTHSPLINLSIEQLYDSALVQEGLHPNPSEMLPRIQELLHLAAQSATNGGASNGR